MAEAGEPIEEALLFALDDLHGDNFKRFKNKLCFLKTEGKVRLPWSQLRDADTVDTVQLLIHTYGEEGARDVVVEVLKLINLRDSASRLQKWKYNDCKKQYQQHIQETFGSRGARPGTTGSLHRTYTELLLTRLPGLPEEGHELVAAERKHREMETHPEEFLTVSLESLFDSDPQSSRTTVLLGPAGVGKTTAMWKIMLDWASGVFYPEKFDYVFYIPCGALNPNSKPMSMAELMLCSCGSPGELTVEDMFVNPECILVIVDGFDELQHAGFPSDLLHKQSPEKLVMGLLQRKLLPKCHLLVTTRPTALGSLQPHLKLPRFVEALGFRPAQRKEYFHCFFENEGEATRALEILQRNETVFDMCFLPMVCWIICSVFRETPRYDLLEQVPETATLTEVYMLLLLSSLEGDFGPSHLEGLCSLAKDGALHKKMVFDEGVLEAHGLSGPDLDAISARGRILQQGVFGAGTYQFTHSGFQEFFAALFFLLEKDRDSTLPLTDLNKFLGSRQEYIRGYFLLVRFLFGLSNAKRLSTLRERWGCNTSRRGPLQELLRWVEEGQPHPSRRREHFLELCHCIYEVEDVEFARSVMRHVKNLELQDQLSNKLDFAALSFCLSASDTSHSVWLSGYSLGSAGIGQLLPGLQKSSDIRLNRCGLSAAACEALASVVETNQGLITLDLGENPLHDSGVIHLCNRLIHSGSPLQSLRLNRCNLTAAACESLSRVLASNQHLRELDLSENPLGDLGVRQLCEGLKHLQARLQRLMLHRCGLTAAVCRDLASVLETSETLVELGLGENKLGEEGVRQLSVALKSPDCKLQRLALTMNFLNATTKKKLQAACAVHPQLLLVSYYPPDFPALPEVD